MKVWVIECGIDYGRYVVAVTDKEDVATTIAGLDHSSKVQEFDLNDFADQIVNGARRWDVTFDVKSGQCVDARIGDCPLHLQEWRPSVLAMGTTFEFHVNARNKVEAIRLGTKQLRLHGKRLKADVSTRARRRLEIANGDERSAIRVVASDR